MSYNYPSPDQSSTLTATERSAEAICILNLLRKESDDDLERKLTTAVKQFLSGLWMQQDFLLAGGELRVSVSQLLWLRDLKGKFD